MDPDTNWSEILKFVFVLVRSEVSVLVGGSMVPMTHKDDSPRAKSMVEMDERSRIKIFEISSF